MVARNVRLDATLLTDDTPLPNKSIEFFHRVSGGATWVSDGTVDTDEYGVASKTITLDVPQTYDFKAEFYGDEDYDPSTATVSNYRVKAKTTLTLTATPL
jgi:hypothetical protein